jgi:hypothetical protein
LGVAACLFARGDDVALPEEERLWLRCTLAGAIGLPQALGCDDYAAEIHRRRVLIYLKSTRARCR